MAHFLPSGYKVCWVIKVSRYKADRSREFIPGYKVAGGHWCSMAPKALTEAQQASGVQRF